MTVGSPGPLVSTSATSLVATRLLLPILNVKLYVLSQNEC